MGVLPENEPQLKTLILGEFLSPFLTVISIAEKNAIFKYTHIKTKD